MQNMINKTMKRFKLGFRNAPVAKKLETARRCAQGVATLPPKKRPGAPIAELQDKLAEISAAQQRTMRLRAELKASVTAEKNLLTEVCDLTTRCAISVWAASAGDNELQLRTAGLDIAASNQTPVSAPGQPTHFRGKAVAGGVELLWRTPLRRCWFDVEMIKAEEPDATWQKLPHAPARARRLVTGLEPGTLYRFRVRAINGHGPGPWTTTLVSVRPL
jgi:hypothetical protein